MSHWKVRKIAEQRGITRYRLAKDAGLEYNTVDGIWKSKTTRIDLETLDKLAKALGVPANTLIGNDGEAEIEILSPVLATA